MKKLYKAMGKGDKYGDSALAVTRTFNLCGRPIIADRSKLCSSRNIVNLSPYDNNAVLKHEGFVELPNGTEIERNGYYIYSDKITNITRSTEKTTGPKMGAGIYNWSGLGTVGVWKSSKLILESFRPGDIFYCSYFLRKR